MCDRILILSRGALVADDTPDELARRIAQASTLRLRVRGDEAAVRACLAHISSVTHADLRAQDAGTVEVSLTAEPSDALCEQIFFAFAQAGVPILQMQTEQPDLEDVFLALTAPTRTVEPETEEGEETA